MSTTVGPGRPRPLGDFGVASNGEYQRIEGLPIDAFSQECINKTLAELLEEQDGVKHLL